MHIAILLTCFNRKAKTLAFLRSLAKLQIPAGISLDIWLNDDGSTDGTSDAVQKWADSATHHSSLIALHLIRGSGSDYWCGGMRRTWEAAVQHGRCDYFLWANDDVEWYSDALVELLSVANNPQCAPVGLVCGCFCDPNTSSITYGGCSEKIQLLLPNGIPQRCRYVHGNTVLVPWSTYEKIGIFDCRWRHGFGDTDYGLCCIERGLQCWTTSKYIGTCEQHIIKSPWFSSAVPFVKRWQDAWKPVGGDYLNYIRFRRKHYPLRWPLDAGKFLLQVVFPKPFEWYSKRRVARCAYDG